MPTSFFTIETTKQELVWTI